MKNPSLSILKIFLKNSYSLENFFGKTKKGPKGVFKIIGLSILMLYIVCCFGYMMISTFLGMYNTLAYVNSQHVMPILALIISTAAIFFFGFTTAAVNYYIGNGEEQLLSMPFSPRQYFGAKFMVSIISDATLGFILLVVAGIIFGINEGLCGHFSFWLGLISCASILVSVTVFIIHLLLILFMYFCPALRNKKRLTGLASVLIVIFVLACSTLMTSVSNAAFSKDFLEDSMDLTAILDYVARIEKFPLTPFAYKAFTGNILVSLVFLAISAVIVFVVAPLLSNMYVNSLDGFADERRKKQDAAEIKTALEHTKETTLFKSLLVRDIRGVLREPSFFSNGPLILILMPVILVFSFSIGFITSSGDGIAAVLAELREALTVTFENHHDSFFYFATMIGGIGAFFMGVCSNIASTSFSREGKTMYTLKAMPIDYEVLVEVKVFHALIYVAVAFVEVVVLETLALILLQIPISVMEWLKCIAIMLIFAAAPSVLTIFIDMFIDTVNPKLNWDNPVYAFKNNMNTLFSILGSFVATAIIVVLGIVLSQFGLLALIGIAVVMGVISAPVGYGYNKYAQKKLKEL